MNENYWVLKFILPSPHIYISIQDAFLKFYSDIFFLSPVSEDKKKNLTRVQIKYAQINNTPADKSEFKKELKIQTDEKSYHMSCKFKLLKAS